MKVSDLLPPTRDLVTIGKNQKAIEAFREMSEHNLSGIGVIDHGKLVDVISLRDLKLTREWDETSFSCFWETVGNYKDHLRKTFPGTPLPTHPTVVLKTDTLATVIEKMALEHIHRVFVVDSKESMKPSRVITQTDVLKQLLHLESIFPVQPRK